MNKPLVIALLLCAGSVGPLVYAQAATTCQDLRMLRVERTSLPSVRLLDLVEEMIQGTGWKVESNLKSIRGPEVLGGLSFSSTEDALRHVIERAVDAGWRIEMVLNRANCIITLNVDPMQLAAIATPPAGRAEAAPEREAAATAPLEREAAATLPVSGPADASGPKAPALVNESSQRPWQVQAGKSLRETLAAWAQQAGWEIHWDAKEDLYLLAAAVFQGEFEDSVAKLLAAINAHGHTFRAEAYFGNKVLRILQ